VIEKHNEIILHTYQDSKIKNTKHQQGCRATRTLIHCWWEHKMIEQLWQSLYKAKLVLLQNPTIMLIGVKTVYLKSHVHTKTHTQLLIALIFTQNDSNCIEDVSKDSTASVQKSKSAEQTKDLQTQSMYMSTWNCSQT
jgi:hypothetical protein